MTLAFKIIATAGFTAREGAVNPYDNTAALDGMSANARVWAAGQWLKRQGLHEEVLACNSLRKQRVQINGVVLRWTNTGEIQRAER